MRRLLVRSVLVGGIAMVALVPSVAGAQPTTQSTTCDISANVTIDPGLTFSQRNQTIRLSGNLTNCVGGGVTSALIRGRGSGPMSCTSGSGSGMAGARWDTGDTSIATFSLSVSGEFSGMVTSGLFAGEPITGDLSVQPGPGDCIFRPIKSAKITGTISL